MPEFVLPAVWLWHPPGKRHVLKDDLELLALFEAGVPVEGTLAHRITDEEIKKAWDYINGFFGDAGDASS